MEFVCLKMKTDFYFSLHWIDTLTPWKQSVLKYHFLSIWLLICCRAGLEYKRDTHFVLFYPGDYSFILFQWVLSCRYLLLNCKVIGYVMELSLLYISWIILSQWDCRLHTWVSRILWAINERLCARRLRPGKQQLGYFQPQHALHSHS